MLICYYKNRLTPGYVCGVIVHPFSSTIPSFGISRLILSASNATSCEGPIIAPASAYLASTACNDGVYVYGVIMKINELHD